MNVAAPIRRTAAVGAVLATAVISLLASWPSPATGPAIPRPPASVGPSDGGPVAGPAPPVGLGQRTWPTESVQPGPPANPGQPAKPGQPGTAEPKPIHRHIVRLVPHQFAVVTNPDSLSGSRRRMIVLYPDRVVLRIGATERWTGYFHHRSGFGDRARSLARVARLVRSSPYPSWLTQVTPGVYLLRVAMTQAPGSNLDISAPRVRQLRLLAGKRSYLTGVSARVRFHRTQVTSWLPQGGPDTTPDSHRPFVAYQHRRSVLTITRSRFSYLGGDVRLGYGAVWGPESTGLAADSVFDHNFFGAYSNAAVGVAFRRNVFRDNDVYGLDPHTNSRRLIAEGNEAYGNRTHGIIFSKGVVDSVVTNNRTHHNGANGIMMDHDSNRNLVAGNRTWANRGDGIVVQHSAHVTVRDNVAQGNRVGLRVAGRSGHGRIAGNDLTDNPRGMEIYGVSHGPTSIVGNRVSGGPTSDGVTLRDVPGANLAGNQIRGFRYGIVLSGRTTNTFVRRNSVALAQRGIQVEHGAEQITLLYNEVADTRERGLFLAGAVTSVGDAVSGVACGVEVRGPALVRNLRVVRAGVGISVVSGDPTVLSADVTARRVGLTAKGGATVDLQDSSLRARRPADVAPTIDLAAGNTLYTTPPPVSWLAVAGIAFLVTALVLHLGQRLGAPACHASAAHPPQGVRNAR